MSRAPLVTKASTGGWLMRALVNVGIGQMSVKFIRGRWAGVDEMSLWLRESSSRLLPISGLATVLKGSVDLST